tara:strand:+ start:1138 stop:1737 length:600 start_codon:yes stop_codon:yes gene_type:complete
MKILFLTNKDAENYNQIPNFLSLYGDEITIFFDKINAEFVKDKKIDFIISDRYEHLIKEDVINLLQNKIINLHPSLLPWSRGYYPNFWSIFDDTPKGVSIHKIDKGIDTGDILIQKEIFFEDEDTLKTTYHKVRVAIVNLLFDNWIKIKNFELKGFKKNDVKGTHHYKKDFDEISHLIKKNGWNTKILEIKEIKKNYIK